MLIAMARPVVYQEPVKNMRRLILLAVVLKKTSEAGFENNLEGGNRLSYHEPPRQENNLRPQNGIALLNSKVTFLLNDYLCRDTDKDNQYTDEH